jgi:formylglycine-generating enzyme required for sulfatase activity
MDETPSAHRLPPSDVPDDTPAKRTRNTAAIPTDLTPGESRDYPEIPGYEVLGICGHGAMGVVYRARQLGANRLVALKMIRAVEHASPTERLRFQIETEAVARLQHPNIVQLHEVGEVRGQPFFSLEFCDGGTLTAQLKKQRPTPRESAQLIETLARAMHYAHLRGVVHRDLKPGNVLLSVGQAFQPDGSAGVRLESLTYKITDFGLAKRIDAEARDVSRSGAIMGTAAYMAPEQAAGKVRDTGPAADVYALGALLYECLTGRPPFEGPQHVVLASVLNDEPVPPSRAGGKVPADLETICLKCLSKEPARRYASAEELANDLRRYQAGEPIRARPAGAVERTWKWARRRPALAALVVVTLFALVSLAVLSVNLVVARNDADEKRKAAQQEADKAQKARNFLVSIFKLTDRKVEDGTVTARQILDDADRRIPVEFADQPELRADLEKAIEEVYTSLGTSGPQAMILEAQGTVRLVPVRDEKRQAVPQTLLYQDDRLIVGADADVRLVFLQDFHKERLKPGSEVTIRRRGCQPGEAVGERQDDILLTFKRLPKGTFYMGGGGGQPGKKTEIKEDFEIAAHAVTQYQWQAVMGGNPSHFTHFGGGAFAVKDISDDELKLFPVEQVSWEDVQEFLKRLNEKERGRGYLYRLPSEAEWEYACRGGATSEEACSYHFYFDKATNDLSSKQANFNGGFPFGKGEKGPYLGRPTKVGSYAPNKLGLYDMHGNVCQWTNTAEGSVRVSRGGSWSNFGVGCQAADRGRDAPTYRSGNRGFRLARVRVR